MGAKVAMAALQVLVEEKLAENSERLGKVLRSQLQAIASPRVKLVSHSCLENNSMCQNSIAKLGPNQAWDSHNAEGNSDP